MSDQRSLSFFTRTALLIAGTLGAFALIAWAAIAWSTLIPAAEATGHVLAQKVDAAIAAYEAGAPVPSDVTIEPGTTDPLKGRQRNYSYSLYVNHLERQLRADLPGAEIVVTRTVMPTEIWIRPSKVRDHWFVLYWRIARPATPLAMMGVVLAGALLVLGGAAIFARRMTRPLGNLVAATARIGEGERVAVDTNSGPSEVRSLARAFQSMSNRLAEQDEQRELMLAGLSHDLRSPLARVRVAVELLEGPNATLAQGMTEEIESIDRMIGQLMHYVRAGYQESPIRARLDDIVRAALTYHTTEHPTTAHPTAPPATRIPVRLDLHAQELRWLPVESFRHIVVNLVENAREYGQPPVVVRTAQAPGELRLTVTDAGPGLSPSEWQEAVRPFHRLREAPGTGHTGLGLAMVERLVRVCGGTLTAMRTDRGFTVDVTLATTGD